MTTHQCFNVESDSDARLRASLEQEGVVFSQDDTRSARITHWHLYQLICRLHVISLAVRVTERDPSPREKLIPWSLLGATIQSQIIAFKHQPELKPCEIRGHCSGDPMWVVPLQVLAGIAGERVFDVQLTSTAAQVARLVRVPTWAALVGCAVIAQEIEPSGFPDLSERLKARNAALIPKVPKGVVETLELQGVFSETLAPPDEVPSPEAAPAVEKPLTKKSRATVTWALVAPEVLEREPTDASEKQPTAASEKKPESAVQRLKEFLGGSIERSLPLARPAHIEALRSLKGSFPNFTAVIDDLVLHVRLSLRLRRNIRVPPLLLVGSPGVGKTAFASELAAALRMYFEYHSLADTTAGWLLTGNTKSWSNGRPGIIVRAIRACPNGQGPLILLDELDKSAADSRYPVAPALLGLLEPSTARRFRDENLEIEMDVRPVSFVLTANRIASVAPELLSRLKIFNIPTPTSSQMPAIIRSVDRELRRDEPGLKKLFEPLTDDFVGRVIAIEPRLLKTALLHAYAQALSKAPRQRRRITLDFSDLPPLNAAPITRPPRFVE